MKINLWPLAIILYTDSLPEGVGGKAYGPVVFIRPKYKTDTGLEQHELEHVSQWWLTLGLHSVLYLFRRYRLWSEAFAYHEQMQYPDRKGHFVTLDEAAEMLANPRYQLGISVAEARVALQQ